MALELIANQIVPLSGMRFDSAALLQLLKQGAICLSLEIVVLYLQRVDIPHTHS